MSNKFSLKKKRLVFNKYKGKCAYCGVKIEFNSMHIDHIIPLYRKWSQLELNEYGITKGTNKIENLNPSCPSCNISKSNFTLDQWRDKLVEKIDKLRKNSSFRLLESYSIIRISKSKVKFYFEKANERLDKTT